MYRNTTCILLGLFALAGCTAVGPDYKTPEMELAPKWQAESTISAHSNSTLTGWWKRLQDPILTGLVAGAVANNIDVQSARSRVRQARFQRIVTGASQLPEATASAAAEKSYSTTNDGSPRENDIFSGGFDASWEIDLFGGIRRSVEASQADYEASVEELRDTLVSLVAEVALDYIDVRTYQTRLGITTEQIASQQETLGLLLSLSEAGRGDELAIAQARYNLESAKASIPTLELSLEKSINSLAILTGRPAGSLQSLLETVRTIPEIDAFPDAGVPADLIRRRPDIRKAERLYAAETARIGKAEAERYPSLSLRGSIGLQSSSLDDLFGSPMRIWSGGPTLNVPIFNGGTQRNQVKIQSEVQQQAYYSYQSAVLEATREVENGLVALTKEQEKLHHLVNGLKAAREAEELAKIEYMAGVTDFADVLDAQRSTLSFRDQLTQSSAQVVAELISLYKALGGGWETETDGAMMKKKNRS